MQVWNQVYLPLGGVGWSALAAGAPIILFFVSLAVLRLKGHVAGALTLALALVIAIAVYGMPAERAFASAAYGFAYGLWPIAWIIVTAVFLYKIVVKSGQFDVIRSSIVSLTDDQRLQMLLIGFSFGAFLEGAAGFGAPVAITAALLVGLGFNPLYAAGLCLIADTAPVAFGALGIPVIVAGQVSGLDPMAVGAMAGRQLPFLSFFLPFWLVFVMDGVKGVRETWPAALVAGGSFALVQFFTSNYIGPELPDVTSALASLVALASFRKVWRPLRGGLWAASRRGYPRHVADPDRPAESFATSLDATSALARLSDSAREHGLRIAVEVVVDRVAREHPLHDAHRDWYVVDERDDALIDPRTAALAHDVAHANVGSA
ncbi:lactate permease LctP family transporter, partial [Burkholderia pseudomallei]